MSSRHARFVLRHAAVCNTYCYLRTDAHLLATVVLLANACWSPTDRGLHGMLTTPARQIVELSCCSWFDIFIDVPPSSPSNTRASGRRGLLPICLDACRNFRAVRRRPISAVRPSHLPIQCGVLQPPPPRVRALAAACALGATLGPGSSDLRHKVPCVGEALQLPTRLPHPGRHCAATPARGTDLAACHPCRVAPGTTAVRHKPRAWSRA